MHIQRVVTVCNVEVDKLPPDLRVLSKLDKQVVKNSSSYFEKAASKAKFDWLRKVFDECRNSGWQLEFYATGQNEFVPYFRFYWGGGPAICLPRTYATRPDLPAVLKHFYELIGGFQENPFGYAGGIDRSDQLCSIEETGVWVAEENTIDPSRAIAFLETLGGDRLCYLPEGQGAWLTDGYFRPVESLEREIARYFEALLEGSRI